MKHIILDTNVLISDPAAIFKFQDNHIIIPSTVLIELDGIKDRRTKNDADREAREAIKHIESCMGSHSPTQIAQGVPINYPKAIANKGGTISIVFHSKNNIDNKVEEKGLDISPDSKIIASALILQEKLKSVTLVSQDTNMRLIAAAAGVIKVENYKNEDAINDLDFLPSGKVFIKASSWDEIEYNNGISDDGQYIEFDDSITGSTSYAGAYVFFEDTTECIGCILDVQDGKAKMRQINMKKIMNNRVFGLLPQNLEQGLLLDALTCKNSQLVSVVGKSGTGKTLLIIAALLHAALIEKRFDQIIICRSMVELGEPVGALPGDLTQKTQPWMGGVNDAIKFLAKNYTDSNGKPEPKYSSPEYLIEKAGIVFTSISFLRGDSPSSTCIFLDESQNTNRHVMKALLTRVATGSMFVNAGHLGQCDTNTNPLQSGLVHLITTMKNFKYSKCVKLEKNQRSELAEYAEEVM